MGGYTVTGKIAFITGVGAGFGSELAVRLVAKGARVFGCDINAANGQRVVDAIAARFGPDAAAFAVCDVSDLADLERVFKAAVARFGRVDIVVNNAGIGETSRFSDDPDSNWKLVMDIDLYAVIKGTHLALNQMRTQNPPGGVVVNVASMAGFLPDPNMPVYVAAKMGVVGFTRSLGWKIFKNQNVRVNGVAPTFAMTNMGKLAAQDPDLKKYVQASSVPVSLVIDAFMRAIEDDTLAGDIVRITAEKGIDVLPKKDLTTVADKNAAKAKAKI
ncbi:hypothetical protein HK100_010215 [Physocladia obscura]|uniref:Uncharacterized protein n=1 Tax=Physocladia obscura TaxID=109957 RepID=A0AAD5T369_9FUNG|nr:hypothetical protein HK100_010215 [Physocladia obscura]